MARLPRRSPVSSSASLNQDAGAASSLGTNDASVRSVTGFEKRDAVGERGGRSASQHGLPQGAPHEDGVELDAAIESMLAAGGVDPVTRVRLSEARRAIAEGAQANDPDGFEGANLSRALFRFVMPRLHHPEVLRGDRHRALLEGLAEGLAETDEDGIVREGALVVHRELRRLALLRNARNALVEG